VKLAVFSLTHMAPAGIFAVAIASFSFPAVFPAVAFEKNRSKNTIDLLNPHGKFYYGFVLSAKKKSEDTLIYIPFICY